MEFEVRSKKLNMVASGHRDVQQKLNALNSELENCRKNLRGCLSSSASSDITRAIDRVHNKVGSTANKFGRMGDKLDTIARMYTETERNISGKKAAADGIAMPKNGTSMPSKNATPQGFPQILFNLFGLNGAPDENITDMAKWISKIVKKLNDTSVIGIMGDSLAYGNDLWELLYKTWKGDVGADVVFNLAEDGGKLWEGIYKLFDKNLMKQLGMDGGTALGQRFGNTVGYVALASSFAGFLDKYVDTVGGEYQSWQEQVGAWFATGGKAADVAENAYNLQNMTKGVVSKGAKSIGGWFTLGETILNTGGQAFTSYGKYNADGVITGTEAAQIGLESSVKGLTTLVSGVTFGIVDIDSESLSQTLENWGTEQGYAIGRVISRNPDIKDKFMNGNFAEQMYAFGWGAIHSIFG